MSCLICILSKHMMQFQASLKHDHTKPTTNTQMLCVCASLTTRTASTATQLLHYRQHWLLVAFHSFPIYLLHSSTSLHAFTTLLLLFCLLHAFVTPLLLLLLCCPFPVAALARHSRLSRHSRLCITAVIIGLRACGLLCGGCGVWRVQLAHLQCGAQAL